MSKGSPGQHTEVHGLNHHGEGVGRINGKTIFIDGALPGEVVRIRALRKRRSYDRAVLDSIHQASPERITPDCKYFGSCGGCCLQHLNISAQVSYKQKHVAETLARIARVVPDAWVDPITGPPWHYRRRARLGVRVVPKKGGVMIGFREKRHSFIIDLHTCPILSQPIPELLPSLHTLVAKLARPHRLPQIEVAVGDERAALVFRHLDTLIDDDRSLLRDYAQDHDVDVYLQPGGAESARPLYPESPEPLTYYLPKHDIRLRFRPIDFIQVNAAVNQHTVDQAIDWLALEPDDTVLDLFSGLGNFTLPIARHCRRVRGVDADAGLIEMAKRNAGENAVTNAEFIAADLNQAMLDIWHQSSFNKVIIDPPRTGAIKILKAMGEHHLPRRLVYVSCYPATLARDSEYLVHRLGYRLARMGVMDMFPHTSHIEAMALFLKE
jgi:23S rRNA (uracil1939-C5)-methyltransferase